MIDVRRRSQGSPGAADRGDIDVTGVDLEPVHAGAQHGTHRTGSTAELDDDGPRSGARHRLPRQEFRSPAGDEYPWIQRDPQPAELRPSDDDLERDAGHPARHHGLERARVRRLGNEQPGLVLGEDASRRAEPEHDRILGAARRHEGHASTRAAATAAMPIGAGAQVGMLTPTPRARRRPGWVSLAHQGMDASLLQELLGPTEPRRHAAITLSETLTPDTGLKQPASSVAHMGKQLIR